MAAVQFWKKKWPQKTLTVLFLLLMVGGAGEILCRAIFPEYGNYILTDKYTMGKRVFVAPVLQGTSRIRASASRMEFSPGDHIVLIFGDSVTFGYGLAYEDVFWNYWQRMLELKGEDIKIVPLAEYGNNYKSSMESMKQIIGANKNRLKIAAVVYQFNLNDLMPYTPQDLKKLKHLEIKNSWVSKAIKRLVYIRVTFLNHSVLLRVCANKLAHWVYDNTGVDCEELGMDGLGAYTYAFGARNARQTSMNIWEKFLKKY